MGKGACSGMPFVGRRCLEKGEMAKGKRGKGKQQLRLKVSWFGKL
jgi:hypothetical protein